MMIADNMLHVRQNSSHSKQSGTLASIKKKAAQHIEKAGLKAAPHILGSLRSNPPPSS